MSHLNYLAVALAAAGSVQVMNVQTEPIGPNEYRITVTLEGTTEPYAAASSVATAAEQACANFNIVYGKYRFELSQLASNTPRTAPDRLIFRQDIACTDHVEASVAAAPKELSQIELDALAPSIMELSNRFFSAHDKGDDSVTFAVIDQEAMGQSFAEWSDNAAENRKELGAPAVRRLVRLTWYQNPPAAPRPGLYAAVDFSAKYAQVDECGYLIWTRPSSRTTFLITRKEVTLIDHSLDAATRANMRAKFCPGG